MEIAVSAAVNGPLPFVISDEAPSVVGESRSGLDCGSGNGLAMNVDALPLPSDVAISPWLRLEVDCEPSLACEDELELNDAPGPRVAIEGPAENSAGEVFPKEAVEKGDVDPRSGPASCSVETESPALVFTGVSTPLVVDRIWSPEALPSVFGSVLGWIEDMATADTTASDPVAVDAICDGLPPALANTVVA